jgi:UDP-4-amino-4,6-dideoxy-N-acetyl-beta-L-altrosamine transaminase
MIPYGRHHIDEDDIHAVAQVLRGSHLTQGPAVEAFEDAVKSYVGCRYAVAVASGTAALHLAALAAGVGPRRDLATSPITFVASANAAAYVGGRALFVDIDPATVNMSPALLAAQIAREPGLQAVIPVHFAGLPCDMAEIARVAAAGGVKVIEDAAHALGATYPDGSRVGCCRYSLMTIFSFHPVKAIAAGEGGMITTNDPDVYHRLLRLRSHGINKVGDALRFGDLARTGDLANPWYYEMQELGFHFRITDIQCALALSQLRKIDRFIARRRELVRVYDEAFSGVPHVRPAQTGGRAESAHHLYVLRVDFRSSGLTRAEFMHRLRAADVGTQVHYIPVPMHPYYRDLGADPTAYPAAQAYYEEAISIPLFFDLTDSQQAHVIATIRETLR